MCYNRRSATNTNDELNVYIDHAISNAFHRSLDRLYSRLTVHLIPNILKIILLEICTYMKHFFFAPI